MSADDPAAFTPLVEEYSAALHGYFARRMPGAADDLLAEAWLQAFAARRTFDPSRGSARGWLFGLDRLDTNPALLLRQIETTTKASADEDEDAGTFGFVQAGTLLADAPASPRLRSGLFRALGRLKGVSVVGTVKDSTGRTGTELAYRGGVGTTKVIIDPKTSTLLELVEPWRSEKDQRRQTQLSVGLTDTIG
jgi:hypothetical protein